MEVGQGPGRSHEAKFNLNFGGLNEMGGLVSQLIKKTCELLGMSTPAEYPHEYLEHDLRGKH